MWSINNTLLEIAGYKLSYIEFIGTLAGLLAVALAARNKIINWPIGLVNVTCFFLIFYEVRLYSDMFLQVYFFATGLYGWWYWHRHDPRHQAIRRLSARQRWQLAASIAVGTAVLGYGIAHVHEVWPRVFPEPAAFPYVDTFIAVASVAGNWLLARRVIENWMLWIAVDVIATVLYFIKGIKFISLEYFIFLLIAIGGLLAWRKVMAAQQADPVSA
jgi:nicotinamide mononucleotide transporter